MKFWSVSNSFSNVVQTPHLPFRKSSPTCTANSPPPPAAIQQFVAYKKSSAFLAQRYTFINGVSYRFFLEWYLKREDKAFSGAEELAAFMPLLWCVNSKHISFHVLDQYNSRVVIRCFAKKRCVTDPVVIYVKDQFPCLILCDIRQSAFKLPGQSEWRTYCLKCGVRISEVPFNLSSERHFWQITNFVTSSPGTLEHASIVFFHIIARGVSFH